MERVACFLIMLFLVDLVSVYSVDPSTCPEGQRSTVDYGDLTRTGSGRLLQVNGNHFEIFGEKVFLSGLSGTIRNINHGLFGDDAYQSEIHECFFRNLSLSGGNSNVVSLHGGATKTPIFNATGYVVSLDSTGSFIKNVRRYLRAAAHYDIAVFLDIWSGHVFEKHPQLINDGPRLKSYIENALLPLTKAIIDEPGFGGFSIINNADNLIKAENNAEPCYDTHQLKAHTRRTLSMKEFLRFLGKHIEAIRSIDASIPVTIKTYNWTEISPFHNHFADECFQKAGGSSKINTTYYNQDKPIVLNHLTPISSLPEKYQYAYSHGYSGAWAALSSKSDQTENFSGLQALKSEENFSLGGLVNFTLTKYEICRQDRTKCAHTN